MDSNVAFLLRHRDRCVTGINAPRASRAIEIIVVPRIEHNLPKRALVVFFYNNLSCLNASRGKLARYISQRTGFARSVESIRDWDSRNQESHTIGDQRVVGKWNKDSRSSRLGNWIAGRLRLR
jgi:hypothetical protein